MTFEMRVHSGILQHSKYVRPAFEMCVLIRLAVFEIRAPRYSTTFEMRASRHPTMFGTRVQASDGIRNTCPGIRQHSESAFGTRV